VRVLVVEDERKVASFVARSLQEEGFAVDVAHEGREGLERALGTDYDAIVLDVMLPGLDGLGLVSQLRQEGRRTPVLLLTARDTVGDRVKGLDSGADDYLVKPFAVEELLARVRALLRRRDGVLRPGPLAVGDLVLDPDTRRARRGDREIELTAKEYALLDYFMRNPGRVLTRPMIAEHVWNVDFDTFSNVIDVYVAYLRNKIDAPFDVKLLRTVRGMGYMLEPPRAGGSR
jgi:two-component system, OmpR family, copper resistance phosphate regulon response regulator CusR